MAHKRVHRHSGRSNLGGWYFKGDNRSPDGTDSGGWSFGSHLAGPINEDSPYADKFGNSWQTGLCDAYALALIREHPGLRLGGSGDVDAAAPAHWWAHDDTHAYDSLGKHPLPYLGANNQFEEQVLDQDPEYWGLPWNSGEEEIQIAQQEIRNKRQSKTAFEDVYSPLTCHYCGGPMGEPHQVSNAWGIPEWVNSCTRCHRTRQVNSQDPMLKRQQENFPGYPQALEDVGPQRPWVFSKTAMSPEGERLLSASQIARLYGVYPTAVSNWKSRSYVNFPAEAQPGRWSPSAIQNWAQGRNMTPAMDLEELLAEQARRPGPVPRKEPPQPPLESLPVTHMEPWGEPDWQEQPWRGKRYPTYTPDNVDDNYPADDPVLDYGRRIGKVAEQQGWTDFYHVSPRANRESIQNLGLMGDNGSSPWSDPWERNQPHGNYFFDNPQDAENYAWNLKGRQGDGESAWDRYEQEEPPEGFHQWPEDQQEEWYDNAEYKEKAEDPSGYDIWKVNTRNLPIHRDPEAAINQDEPPTDQQLQQHFQESGPTDWDWGGDPWQTQLVDHMRDYGQTPRRFYTPELVNPARMQLHQHLPSWNMGEEQSHERMDDPTTEEQEVPVAWDEMQLRRPQFPAHSKTAAMKPWMPGQYGKGFLSPLGSPVHWQTDGPDGYPDHPTMMNRLPYGGSLPEHYFYIEPDGGVDWFPDKPPKDTQPLDKFLQGNQAFYDRKHYAFPQRMATEIREWPGESTAWEGRTPAIYDPHGDVLHIGPEGGHHPGLLMNALGEQIGWRNETHYSLGWTGENPEAYHSDYVYNRGKPNEVGWYSVTPRPPARVHQMLDEWSQGKITPMSRALSQTFSTVPFKPWEQGSTGKGIILPMSQKPLTWKEEEWSQEPSHSQMIKRYAPQGEAWPFYVKEDGEAVPAGWNFPPEWKGWVERDPKLWTTSSLHKLAFPTVDDPDDYRGHHQAPGPEATPLTDLTQGLPEDIYTHPQYYGNPGDPEESAFDRESYAQIQAARNNPEVPVSIHRAGPSNAINTGDWVSLSHGYAKRHGMHADDPSQDMRVWSARVPAKHLWWDGNSLNEFGYHGPPLEGQRFCRTQSNPELRPGSEIDKGSRTSNSEFKRGTLVPMRPQTHQSGWGLTPDELPPEQHQFFQNPKTPGYGQHHPFLNNLPAGTRVWRGEYARSGRPEEQSDIGMRWSVDPGAAGMYAKWGNPVIWQGTLSDPANQAFPRDHPVWRQDRSLDWEHEVRLKPDTQMDVEGYWQPHEEGKNAFWPWQGWPREQSGLGKGYNPDNWQFVPMGRQVPIANRGDIPHPGYDHQLSPDEVWEKYEEAQQPSEFQVNFHDKGPYVEQHVFEGNPWGVGYGGPRPWAKPPADPFEVSKEFWG